MAKQPDPFSGWLTYEVYQKDSDGSYTIAPFSNALATSGSMPTQAINKMRMVQDLGWPEAKRRLKDDRGRLLIVKKDDVIWLLKCRPSCWRLYFYVWKNSKEKRIIYVHAVCKKADDENPIEAVQARSIADDIRPGRSAITLFEFPIG